MIQRIQSVWLLLAAICAALLFAWPLYGGTLQTRALKTFYASSSFGLLILTGVVTVLPLIAIFLYKNRPGQLNLIWLALLADIGLLGLVYYTSNRFAQNPAFNFVSSGYKATAVLPIIVFVFLVLAMRGIKADERMIKNADRFRK